MLVERVTALTILFLTWISICAFIIKCAYIARFYHDGFEQITRHLDKQDISFENSTIKYSKQGHNHLIVHKKSKHDLHIFLP